MVSDIKDVNLIVKERYKITLLRNSNNVILWVLYRTFIHVLGQGACHFPGAGGANAEAKFRAKHVSSANANEANAREKSCERMAVPNLRPGGAASSNTVLFGEIAAGFVEPYYHGIQENDPACGKEFNDLFVCSNVPKAHNNVNACLADGHHNGHAMVCRSCRVRYPDATRFFVDVKTSSGHLDFNYVYYITANGWYQTFDTASCL